MPMPHPILPRLEAKLRELRLRWTTRVIEHGLQLRCDSGEVVSVYRSGAIVVGGVESAKADALRQFALENKPPKKAGPERPADPESVTLTGVYSLNPKLEARLAVVAARAGHREVATFVAAAMDALATLGEIAEPLPGETVVYGDDKDGVDAIERLLRFTGWRPVRLERDPKADAPPVRWGAEWTR